LLTEFIIFLFAKPRQRHDGMTVRATEPLNLLYFFDNYALDPDRRELRSGATVVAMEPQAFDLLVHVIRRREHVVSRDELIEQIWGGRIVSESALSTRINAVRSAIGDSGTEQRLIKTLSRKGVRFVGEVREERKPSEALSASSLQRSAAQAIDVRQAIAGLPAPQAQGAEIIVGHSETRSPVIAASRGWRRFFCFTRNARNYRGDRRSVSRGFGVELLRAVSPIRTDESEYRDGDKADPHLRNDQYDLSGGLRSRPRAAAMGGRPRSS
jgi:DNA-binding winged helix-turn-helix (wHTH) protein